jgi:hypothetical protein
MFASNNNFSNNYYEFENNDSSRNSSSYNGIIITTGLFSWTIWKLYSDNVFRRQAIEGYFKTVDTIYNKFYEVWYDDKIRRQMLDKINVMDKHYHNNFDEDDLSNLEHNKSLFDFFFRPLELHSVKIKDKKYYRIGPDADFSLEHVLDCPWLAASIEITSKSGQIMSVDITDKLKELWLHGNKIPIHIEYYDFWIYDFITRKNLITLTSPFKNDKKIISKKDIKEIKLSIINEVGDLIEYSDVLIEPKREITHIVHLPKVTQNEEYNLETDDIEEVEEQVEVVEEVEEVEEQVEEVEEVEEQVEVEVEQVEQDVAEKVSEEVEEKPVEEEEKSIDVVEEKKEEVVENVSEEVEDKPVEEEEKSVEVVEEVVDKIGEEEIEKLSKAETKEENNISGEVD